ncbi:unnamed protein product [Scytosiphon promiscuus]
MKHHEEACRSCGTSAGLRGMLLRLPPSEKGTWLPTPSHRCRRGYSRVSRPSRLCKWLKGT